MLKWFKDFVFCVLFWKSGLYIYSILTIMRIYNRVFISYYREYPILLNINKTITDIILDLMLSYKLLSKKHLDISKLYKIYCDMLDKSMTLEDLGYKFIKEQSYEL